jgi:signal transduction histidine kinase
VRLDELVAAVARNEPDVAVEASEPLAVAGERGALERALANLIENARVHGPAGGRITIAVRPQGDRALLSVSDEGAGIAVADVAHAVQRFWRGAAAGGPGSGLGLAIVDATAVRHGGRLTIEGSRFTLDLPALKDFSRSLGTLPSDSNENEVRT